MLGINAVKGFEYCEGFVYVATKGSQQNDVFRNEDCRITTA